MPELQIIHNFTELVELLVGLNGKTVEASVFLPQDEGGYPVASFAGTVASIAEKGNGRWVLTWESGVRPVSETSITFWSDRFRKAELEFTGEVEDPAEEFEETGHNAFIKVHSNDVIVDLIVYI